MSDGWMIAHSDGIRWRTLDPIGMPDWTTDQREALCFSLRKHADLFAEDDPEDVRIVPAPRPVKGDPMLDHVLKTENPEFNAWRESLPPAYWARYDLSACRIGWEAAKAVAPAAPPSTNTSRRSRKRLTPTTPPGGSMADPTTTTDYVVPRFVELSARDKFREAMREILPDHYLKNPNIERLIDGWIGALCWDVWKAAIASQPKDCAAAIREGMPK